MAQTDRPKKSAASRVADIVVLLISLVILAGGFLAWRVYQAGPARNAYDLAVGIFEDSNKEVKELREKAEPLLSNCTECCGDAATCEALQAAYEASDFDEPKKLSRITARGTYEKESVRLAEQTELARSLRNDLQTQIDAVNGAVEKKIGPQRTQMHELAHQAESEISATQDLVNKVQGHVDDSVLAQAQEAIDALQGLVDQAHAMTSCNPEDYTALNGQLRAGVENVTNWNLKVNNRYRG